MRTLALAICSIVVAAVVYLVGIAVAWLVLFFVAFAMMAASGGRPQSGRVNEYLLLFLPAVATGAVVVRVRPFFYPLISAAMGTAVALWAFCVLVGSAGQWELILYPAGAGILATIGGILALRVQGKLLSSAAPQGQP